LRKFRHNLTQLKDSLANGQAYKVIEREQPLAYFIPVDYKVTLEKKTFDYEKEYRRAIKDKT
jgi:hypothetical protein